ncbi:condensin complex subunit 3 [Exophiala viscosa]|uniref:Condensin complex subunit 3 n=1 Tax=Exophiala viscosa TaxID=2486360 RepID=A0AAN6DV38_9EURO|nr:condensin complex subunit 3 [Exophiala viscosa]KAI1626303.1 condensin complex subunit 3 [Exophiala viscosa]
MSVGELFADAQRSLVGHKSLAKRLRRLENSPNFEAHVKQCVFRLLDVSKSEVAGNRVIKFLSIYLESADASSRTTSSILLALLPFLCAKDKTVRYRATQIISQILGVLSAIDDDLYKVIRHELIKRLRDKVPAIRLEAVLALGRLVLNEMEEEDEEQDSDEDVAPGLLEKLLDVLQNDTNADVRRALLLNLPLTPKTLPYLLERARDRDAPTRRALYSRLLPKLGDFRHLSLSMREKLLRWGLRDRDEKVRQATARLFRERWIEDCAGSRVEQTIVDDADQPKEKVGFYDPDIAALLELLERIDTLNTGNETGIAREAMKEFWTGRPDYLQAVSFDDEFWDNLTPESAFMARTFNDYCQQQQEPKYQAMIEEKMPEVTRLGFHLQKHINELLVRVQAANETDTDEKLAEQAEQEFIVEQLLYIAQTLDYTDEVGRRKMFSLLRHALSMADLPEECTRLCVEALRLVCNRDAAGEREFTSVVLEAIAEVHDNIASDDPEDEVPDNDDESFVSARSEVSDHSSDSTPTNGGVSNGKKNKNKNLSEEEQEAQAIKEIVINMKCLHIAQCMLQNVAGNLQSNIHLRTMFDNLVIPAVRSHEVLIRERGVQCLGLCCLLEPKLADENMRLFTHLLKKGHETLQVMSLQILCDILMARGPAPVDGGAAAAPTSPNTSGGEIETSTTNNNHHSQNMTSMLAPFIKALSQNCPEEVRATATTSLCKLMLCGFYKDNEELFDQIVERAMQVTAKGWELLEKVKNAVVVDREKEKEKEGVTVIGATRLSTEGIGSSTPGRPSVTPGRKSGITPGRRITTGRMSDEGLDISA